MYKQLMSQYLKPMKPIPTTLHPNGALQKPIQCLLCDIYGTLFISSSGDISIASRQTQQYDRFETLTAKYNLSICPSHLLEQFYIAIEQAHNAAKDQGVTYPEVRIDQIWQSVTQWDNIKAVRTFALEFEMIMNPVWPMPHLRALLDACLANSVRLGIISNAQFYTPYLFNYFLNTKVADLGFDPDLTIFSYHCGQAKPAAQLFELAQDRLQQMGIIEQSVAYIGNDMRNDIAPACAAGFQTILFAGDERSLRLRQNDPQCSNIEPDLIATDLEQVIPYLQATTVR